MIHPRLSQVLKTQTGQKFRGIFTDSEDQFSGSDVRGRRLLRVSERVPIATGDIILRGSDSYLLFAHSRANGQKRFLAFQVTHVVRWARMMRIIDPVTRMGAALAPQTLSPALSIVVEPTKTFEDLNIKRTGYEIRAPAGVLPGDILGEFKVQTVQNVPGACLIEAF